MVLREVKSTKEGKCSKCGRNIKRGWIIGFDDSTKQVYCKPCATILIQKNDSPVIKPESFRDGEILGILDLHTNNLGAIMERLDIINTNIIELSSKINPKTKVEKK